jgi:divalent metal cation (Fe/Co/Zn/Cd) transporter
MQVQRAIDEFFRSAAVGARPHDLEVQQLGGELSVSFHCTLAARTAIGEAHKLSEQLEQRLRARIPPLARVVIHVEPYGHAE